MKLLSRLVIAFAVCLMAFPALILTTPVQALNPVIDVSRSTGYVGDEVSVYGDNFEPYSDISVYYYITSDDPDYVGGDTVDSEAVSQSTSMSLRVTGGATKSGFTMIQTISMLPLPLNQCWR